ncbi:hypothetical protein WISP_29053 [Willisornis vidua]|uniref:Uncharacterized protein n=1 Tax=Willisornis vidua TaxID=1566151 RepID=A0ABQ9DRB7_9PASS|nr:hypothetical protein WISP_29053 [Willisornis vidua]
MSLVLQESLLPYLSFRNIKSWGLKARNRVGFKHSKSEDLWSLATRTERTLGSLVGFNLSQHGQCLLSKAWKEKTTTMMMMMMMMIDDDDDDGDDDDDDGCLFYS